MLNYYVTLLESTSNLSLRNQAILIPMCFIMQPNLGFSFFELPVHTVKWKPVR